MYDWGNNVLFRGLFGAMKPACGDVGPAGAFNSAAASGGTYTATQGSGSGSFKGGCNDEAWSDGDGEGGGGGPTAFTVEELVAHYNAFDWTDGLLVRQARVQLRDESVCRTAAIGRTCYPELVSENFGFEETRPFGHNWTDQDAPLAQPFRFQTA